MTIYYFFQIVLFCTCNGTSSCWFFRSTAEIVLFCSTHSTGQHNCCFWQCETKIVWPFLHSLLFSFYQTYKFLPPLSLNFKKSIVLFQRWFMNMKQIHKHVNSSLGSYTNKVNIAWRVFLLGHNNDLWDYMIAIWKQKHIEMGKDTTTSQTWHNLLPTSRKSFIQRC